MTPQWRIRRRRVTWVAAGVGLLLLGLRLVLGPLPIHLGTPADAPAALATWPWPNAVQTMPYPGITHWMDTSSPDGTVVDLFEIDFAANPRLRLSLYDQDEDDAVPYDNQVLFWHTGVAQAMRHLQRRDGKSVLLAWNGFFFAHEKRRDMRQAVARHIAPVVQHGVVRYNVGNFRWSFGVRTVAGHPVFTTLHQPSRTELAKTYDFAAVEAQCLIRNGQPLSLQPFPTPGAPPLPQPVPSTPEEVGHIPIVDHMRTSRASMGWSRDGNTLAVLIVKEPDSEAASIFAQRHNLPLLGGWTVADLQRFWLAYGAWGAVNADGGEIMQCLARRVDGRYDLIPARWATRAMRLTLPEDLSGAPEGGGTVMYFVVREE